jgi:hypothetical protein
VSAKQDRQGVRTAAQLEQKYQFGKQFAEIMGIALDNQKSVSELESSLRHEILEQMTSITRDTERIIMTALESYVETTDLEELKSSLRTDFEVWSGGIAALVEQTESRIEEVDGDLQEKFNTIAKYFTFDINGLTVGQVDNPNKVVVDNDEVTIYVNNSIVITFRADGSSYIPTLNVTKQANIVGLAITETDTHINIDYVGVVTIGN